MATQNWRRGIVISLVIFVLSAGVSYNGIRSFLFVQMPNGVTVLWQLEPSAVKPNPANNRIESFSQQEFHHFKLSLFIN
jgi:hypothetical protein